MPKWLRRIRGAVGMGLTWAIAWAMVGLLIGVVSLLLPGLPWDRFFEVFDAPLPALAVPGFVGGAIFSVVLGFVARRRRFSELSLPIFAVCGALGGLLLAQIPNTMVMLGLGTPAAGANLWRLTMMASGPFALLGAASACTTLMIARKVEDVAPSEASDDVAELSESEARELLGPGNDAGAPLRRQAAKEPVQRRSRDA
jgi:hypothetical protein